MDRGPQFVGWDVEQGRSSPLAFGTKKGRGMKQRHFKDAVRLGAFSHYERKSRSVSALREIWWLLPLVIAVAIATYMI